MIPRASVCLSSEVIFATSCRSLDLTKLVGLAFLLEISLHDTKSKHMFVKWFCWTQVPTWSSVLGSYGVTNCKHGFDATMRKEKVELCYWCYNFDKKYNSGRPNHNGFIHSFWHIASIWQNLWILQTSQVKRITNTSSKDECQPYAYNITN
jgi:hypothetical protein